MQPWKLRAITSLTVLLACTALASPAPARSAAAKPKPRPTSWAQRVRRVWSTHNWGGPRGRRSESPSKQCCRRGGRAPPPRCGPMLRRPFEDPLRLQAAFTMVLLDLDYTAGRDTLLRYLHALALNRARGGGLGASHGGRRRPGGAVGREPSVGRGHRGARLPGVREAARPEAPGRSAGPGALHRRRPVRGDGGDAPQGGTRAPAGAARRAAASTEEGVAERLLPRRLRPSTRPVGEARAARAQSHLPGQTATRCSDSPSAYYTGIAEKPAG